MKDEKLRVPAKEVYDEIQRCKTITEPKDTRDFIGLLFPGVVAQVKENKINRWFITNIEMNLPESITFTVEGKKNLKDFTMDLRIDIQKKEMPRPQGYTNDLHFVRWNGSSQFTGRGLS